MFLNRFSRFLLLALNFSSRWVNGYETLALSERRGSEGSSDFKNTILPRL
jgi:hypothetical protein